MEINEEQILRLFSLKEKVAIITGGSGMLGQKYTEILEAAGADVIWFDIKGHGDANVDITNKKQVARAVQTVIKNFGQIDILVNNAAMTDFSGFKDSNRFVPYENFSLEIWEKEIGVGLTGALICSQAVIPHMKKAESGVIVNISSTHGIVAPDNRIYGEGKFKAITYPVIKSGIIGLTKALASYLAPYGIRVNTLVPGGVQANYLDKEFEKKYSFQTMMNRMAKPDDYNGAMLFLCSDASAYMTGASLIVDGGLTAW